MGFVCAHTAFAVSVDTKSYDPASGVVVKVAGKTPVSYTHLTLPTNREV